MKAKSLDLWCSYTNEQKLICIKSVLLKKKHYLLSNFLKTGSHTFLSKIYYQVVINNRQRANEVPPTLHLLGLKLIQVGLIQIQKKIYFRKMFLFLFLFSFKSTNIKPLQKPWRLLLYILLLFQSDQAKNGLETQSPQLEDTLKILGLKYISNILNNFFPIFNIHFFALKVCNQLTILVSVIYFLIINYSKT